MDEGCGGCGGNQENEDMHMQDSTHGSIYEELNDSFENMDLNILGGFEEMQDQTLISDFYFDKGMTKASDEEEKGDN